MKSKAPESYTADGIKSYAYYLRVHFIFFERNGLVTANRRHDGSFGLFINVNFILVKTPGRCHGLYSIPTALPCCARGFAGALQKKHSRGIDASHRLLCPRGSSQYLFTPDERGTRQQVFEVIYNDSLIDIFVLLYVRRNIGPAHSHCLQEVHWYNCSSPLPRIHSLRKRGEVACLTRKRGWGYAVILLLTNICCQGRARCQTCFLKQAPLPITEIGRAHV